MDEKQDSNDKNENLDVTIGSYDGDFVRTYRYIYIYRK